MSEILNEKWHTKLKKEKEKTIMVKNWYDLKEKYPEDRACMTIEREREFVQDISNCFENEGFNKVFWSDYNNVGEVEYYGKPFKVIGRTSEIRNNLCLLPLWDIEFEDGKQLTVEPHEIFTDSMRAHGCPEKYLINTKEEENKEDLNCLYARLIMKLQCELFSYKEKLYRMTVDEVMNEAYKLTMLREFVKVFETQAKERLNAKQVNFFLRMDNALEYLYEVWLGDDSNEQEIYADFLFTNWNWEM